MEATSHSKILKTQSWWLLLQKMALKPKVTEYDTTYKVDHQWVCREIIFLLVLWQIIIVIRVIMSQRTKRIISSLEHHIVCIMILKHNWLTSVPINIRFGGELYKQRWIWRLRVVFLWNWQTNDWPRLVWSQFLSLKELNR